MLVNNLEGELAYTVDAEHPNYLVRSATRDGRIAALRAIVESVDRFLREPDETFEHDHSPTGA